jgi:hypothetical protein
MKLVGEDDFRDDDSEGPGIDFDDANVQELEAIAYRFVQIVPDRCQKLAQTWAKSGVNHPVVCLCDVADPMGLAIAKKFAVPKVIDNALQQTPKERRPGVLTWFDLESIEGKEPTIHTAVRDRMAGLIGYFPILVAAKGGFTVFPWPHKLSEESKFMVFV